MAEYEVHQKCIISEISPIKDMSQSDQLIEKCFVGCDLKQWGGLMKEMKQNGHFDVVVNQTTVDEDGYHEKKIKL